MKISEKELQALRNQYPAGTRIKLIKMDDPYNEKLIPGCLGTVRLVDDIGTIHVCWDCGSHLCIVYGEDVCTKL